MDIREWDAYELVLDGPCEGNAFTKVDLSARIRWASRARRSPGATTATAPAECASCRTSKLRGQTRRPATIGTGRTVGRLHVRGARGNRGPVRVCSTYHLGYADGAPFKPVGTTA